MKKSGKNITKAREAVEKRPYLMKDAVTLLQKVKYAKFDETVEITMRLGVDPKHADQMVRGTVVLPHGLGKSKRVLVIATGDKIKEAEAAGADFVGGEEMVEKINKENWTDFDALIATPDVMKSVGRLGKVLGPKGLMPNPKTGTVTFDVGKAVQEVKAGKVEFRTDKTALVHVPVGTDQALADLAATGGHRPWLPGRVVQQHDRAPAVRTRYGCVMAAFGLATEAGAWFSRTWCRTLALAINSMRNMRFPAADDRGVWYQGRLT